jgi:hypothetical protein
VFHGLLPDLIIPAVRNKEEPALRDQGLVCLGLCCMIDSVCLGTWGRYPLMRQKMAANSFGLFIQQLSAADDELKIKVVHIVFDLLMVQDINDLVSKTMSVSGECVGADGTVADRRWTKWSSLSGTHCHKTSRMSRRRRVRVLPSLCWRG